MERDPTLAVVIPVYRQGEYLADAVLSAARQTIEPVRIVVVDDGCPTPVTRREARWLADALPDTVTYLRTGNHGVAHARNFGARFALAAWPSVQAVCFLDADDRLSPHSLEALWKALADSPASTGWAYANLEYFGNRLGAWNIPRPFSRFRELFENQCGMGCLVHRRVFETGLFFEGGTEATYEDWEFFIRATQLGFSGVHAGSVGVRYRIRDNSRLAECQANYDDLYERMSNRNWSAFEPRERTRIEHDEMPRFALVSFDDERAWLFTDPLNPRRTSVPLDELAWTFSQYVSEYPDSTTYVAPIVLLATGVIRDWLGSSPSAPGILLRVQHALRTQRVVALTGDGHAPVQLLAATFWDLIEETDTSPPFALEVDDASFCQANGSASAQPVDIAQLGALRASLLGSRSFVRPEILHVDYEQTHSEFALRLALSDQTTFPWAPTPADSARRDAVFVVETLDGRDDTARRTLQLVRGMAELAGDVLLHLVLTESTVRDADEVALSPFATVTSLMSLSRREREDVLLVVLGSADVVVDMGTAAFLAILPRLRRTGSRSCATDLGRTEALESMLAAYGSLIDHFLAASEEQRQACIDLGAPPDTVILVPGDLAALLDAVGLVRA